MQKTKPEPLGTVNSKAIASPYEIADLALRVCLASPNWSRTEAIREALSLLREAETLSQIEAEEEENSRYGIFSLRSTSRAEAFVSASEQRIENLRAFPGAERIGPPEIFDYPVKIKDAVKSISGDDHLRRCQGFLKKALRAEAKVRTGKGLSNKDAAASLKEKWESTIKDEEGFWTFAKMLAPHCPTRRTRKQPGK